MKNSSRTRTVVISLLIQTALSLNVAPIVRQHRNLLLAPLQASTGSDDPVMQLPLLEAQLAAGQGDVTELESAIADAKTAAEFGVRKAQMQFYEAFSSSNLQAMTDLWSAESDVRCIHPAMSSIDGLGNVMASWAQVMVSPFTIEPARTEIEICGTTAICSCIEQTPNGGKLECINIYKRENGSWRMTLHMASPIIMQQAPPDKDPM